LIYVFTLNTVAISSLTMYIQLYWFSCRILWVGMQKHTWLPVFTLVRGMSLYPDKNQFSTALAYSEIMLNIEYRD